MDDARRSRRQVIGLAAAAAAGAATAALARPLETLAANGDPITAGATTEATEATFLTGSSTNYGLFNVERTDDGGTAINASSGNEISGGWAIVGDGNGDGGAGVVGRSDIGTGVYGLSGLEEYTGVGVQGSGGGAGVVGFSDGLGMYGLGSIGVMGDTMPGGTGVYGYVGPTEAPAPTANVGIHAAAPTGYTALKVSGKAVFTRSGRISVSSGRTSISKSVTGVTSSSMVFAVLQQVESGTWVRAAVPSSGKITIYFNRAMPTSSVVAWFVLN